MEDTETAIKNDSPSIPSSRGKSRNKKIALYSIVGTLVLLVAFFVTEKQIGLIGLFEIEDDSGDAEIEDEPWEPWAWETEDTKPAENESRLKDVENLTEYSSLSFESYILATAFIEEELVYREPESNYFYFDNTSLNNEPADSTHEYATLSFEIVSSNQKKYKIVIDVNESLSSFEEIHILEQ